MLNTCNTAQLSLRALRRIQAAKLGEEWAQPKGLKDARGSRAKRDVGCCRLLAWASLEARAMTGAGDRAENTGRQGASVISDGISTLQGKAGHKVQRVRRRLF